MLFFRVILVIGPETLRLDGLDGRRAGADRMIETGERGGEDRQAHHSRKGTQPHEVIWTLTNAIVASRCLNVVAELGVADIIGDEPVTANDLASQCGADADALGQALRLLAANGIFEHGGDAFRHTPASQLLRSDLLGHARSS
jgi:hypothetical protein